jgi:MscS family membrane protein
MPANQALLRKPHPLGNDGVGHTGVRLRLLSDRTKQMRFQSENRRGISKPLSWSYIGVALTVFLFAGSAAYSPAQIPAPPPAKTEPTAKIDPLGRETPRRAVMGALKYAARQDFANGARYLQPTPDQETNLVEVAKEFQALHSKFRGDIDLLSDDPNGTGEAGLPPGQVRAGVLVVGRTTSDVILVRVDDPAFGKIWLISKETVASIPGLYAQMEAEGPTLADRIVPAALTGRRMLGMSLAQWLGWLLSIPISWLLAWLLSLLISAPERFWYNLRKLPSRTVWETRLGMPLRCILAIVIHSVLVYLLRPPLLYRAYYFRFMAALLAVGFAWLVSEIADRSFDRAVNRSQMQQRGGESILVLMQRLTRIVMLIIAFVAALALFGINVETTLAGLGIGGLVIALGAQKTLENLIGGISLLMDKAVHVGNFCKIGNQVGTVEDIGLRSVKLRTLDQSVLVVPNGALAQMQFENFGPRRKCLINQHFSLRIETQVEQLRLVLDRVQRMLDQQPMIDTGSRIRVANFAGAAFELELWAYVKISDWAEFTAIRQDVILKIAEIVEAAGTRFAAPTQLTYLSTDTGLDAEKANVVGSA